MSQDQPRNWQTEQELVTEWHAPGVFNHQDVVDQAAVDAYAAEILNCPFVSLPYQGFWSYTIISADNRVLQFRVLGSPEDLDLDITALAKWVHPWTAPATRFLGVMPNSNLGVWQMEKRPGVNFLNTVATLGEKSLRRTVRGLANFFSQAFLEGGYTPPGRRDKLRARYVKRLDRLAAVCPAFVTAKINETLANLDAIMAGPFALTHSDISATNILVNPANGSLTGVIDWANAGIEPFGKSLWALEHILSFHNADGWHFFTGIQDYQTLFNDFLFSKIGIEVGSPARRTIEHAKTLGILLRYGFYYDTRDKQWHAHTEDFGRMELLFSQSA